MSRRQPARNPFSFKKIVLAIPTGGGGVSGGSEEGSVSGSASNNHLEKNESSTPQSDAWKDSPRMRSPYNSKYLFQARILWRNYLCLHPSSSCLGIAGFRIRYGLNCETSAG